MLKDQETVKIFIASEFDRVWEKGSGDTPTIDVETLYEALGLFFSIGEISEFSDYQVPD
jgi:hypothetical protein